MKISELLIFARDTIEKFGNLEVVFFGIDSDGKPYVIEGPCCGVLEHRRKEEKEYRFFFSLHRPPIQNEPILKVVK